MMKCTSKCKENLVSVIIINYNNKNYLSRCIDSILAQTYKNLELIFIDNQSKDKSFEFMKEEYSNKNILLIRNEVNNGYAGAANQGIKLSNGEYIMIINPDIIMEKNFIEILYNFAESNDEIGAVSGKLLKYDFDSDKKINYIDSVGIDMYKNRKFKDRGQNQLDIGQFNVVEEIFGVCGAAPFYKKNVLDKVAVNGEYFDENFFAYKEDVDLSWRINLAGYKNMYCPNAIAYHGRALGSNNGSKINFIKHRKKQSEFLRGISLRNQILLVEKNETKQSLKGYRFNIFIRKTILLIYMIIFERFSFKYMKQARRLRKENKFKKTEFEKNRTLNFEFLKLIK